VIWWDLLQDFLSDYGTAGKVSMLKNQLKLICTELLQSLVMIISEIGIAELPGNYYYRDVYTSSGSSDQAAPGILQQTDIMKDENNKIAYKKGG
jgi:hypothetical protein